MSQSTFGFIGGLAALSLTAAVQVAVAGDIKPVMVANQVRIQYSDLNLQSPLAAELLITRIAQAAKQACGRRPTLGPGFYVVRERYAACREQAIQNAVATVNQPLVTAAYESRLSSSAERLATR